MVELVSLGGGEQTPLPFLSSLRAFFITLDQYNRVQLGSLFENTTAQLFSPYQPFCNGNFPHHRRRSLFLLRPKQLHLSSSSSSATLVLFSNGISHAQAPHPWTDSHRRRPRPKRPCLRGRTRRRSNSASQPSFLDRQQDLARRRRHYLHPPSGSGYLRTGGGRRTGERFSDGCVPLSASSYCSRDSR
jgi:hypothetical protein